MSDTSYGIEIVPAPKNSWFTPEESNAYYKARYDRAGICLHWWGGGESADRHDSIVNYFLAQGQQGVKSVNYVVSDNKITLMVNPDMVAWCSQGGNPTTISIECQPTLGPEGYKKLGWLIEQLEQRYNRQLPLHRHSEYFATSCCGTISENTTAVEIDKWRNKVYDQPPVPTPAPQPDPVPPAPEVSSHPLNPNDPNQTVTMYTLANAKLVDMRTLAVIKTFQLDTPIEINAAANFNNFDFFQSKYAYTHDTKQGFLTSDLKSTPTPPVPDPVPTPTPGPGNTIPPDVTPTPTPEPTPDPTPSDPWPPTPDPTPVPDPEPTPGPVIPIADSPFKTLVKEIIAAFKKFWGKA